MIDFRDTLGRRERRAGEDLWRDPMVAERIARAAAKQPRAPLPRRRKGIFERLANAYCRFVGRT